ncbi:MAG: hypothetical protein ACFFCS_08225 [Candidatus Hodarchaeota archaeon]
MSYNTFPKGRFKVKPNHAGTQTRIDPSIHLVLGEKIWNYPRIAFFRDYFSLHDDGDFFIMHKDALSQHANVFGLTGTGKTTFLEEVTAQLRGLPILILNLAKENQESRFKVDIPLKYGSFGLDAPYIPCLPKALDLVENYIERSSTNLVAMMAFKHEVKRILPIVMMNWVKKRKCMPESVITLFKSLINYIKKYSYAGDFHKNLLNTTRNRVKYIVKNEYLVHALRYLPHVPWWFGEWVKGKTVFIDLSRCDSVARQLITYNIFQLVRAYIPKVETNKLKYLIICDEAHKILRKPTSGDKDDMEYITKMRTQAIIEELLMEFRSMGVGMIIADQQPSSLMKCAYSLASNKFLFRLNHPCYSLFSTNRDEWEAISRLEDRQLIAIVNGKPAGMQTIDKNELSFKLLLEDG